jgi:hypothetical protein
MDTLLFLVVWFGIFAVPCTIGLAIQWIVDKLRK